jgi:hypothetical protein
MLSIIDVYGWKLRVECRKRNSSMTKPAKFSLEDKEHKTNHAVAGSLIPGKAGP